jgi:hypothetical protein
MASGQSLVRPLVRLRASLENMGTSKHCQRSKSWILGRKVEGNLGLLGSSGYRGPFDIRREGMKPWSSLLLLLLNDKAE